MRRRWNLLPILAWISFANPQTYDAIPIGTPFSRPRQSPQIAADSNFPRGYQPPPRLSHFEPPRTYHQRPVEQPPAFRPPSLNLEQRSRNVQTPHHWQLQQLQQQHPQRFQQGFGAAGAPGQIPRFQSPAQILIPTSTLRKQSQVAPASFENGQINPVNNIIIHLYLNAKDRMSHAEFKTPVHGLFGINTSHGGPGTHSDPIIITKDFDRDTLEFVDSPRGSDPRPNVIEVKATVSTPNRQLENTVNKAVNMELDRAIPKVMDRMRGTAMTMDNGMRKELEEALVDELARNLGETIDNTDISEEDLSKLIEEGFNEITSNEQETTTIVPTTTTRRTTTTTVRSTPQSSPTTTTTTSTTQRPMTTTTTTSRRTSTTTGIPTTTTTTSTTQRPMTTTTTTSRRTSTTTEIPTTVENRKWQNVVIEQSNNEQDEEYPTEESEDISMSTKIVITSSTTTTTTTRPWISRTTPRAVVETKKTGSWVSPTTSTPRDVQSKQYTIATRYGLQNQEAKHVHVVPGFRVTDAVTSLPTRPMTEVSASIIPHRGVVTLESGSEEDSERQKTVTSRVLTIAPVTAVHNLPTKSPALHPSTFSPPLVTETSTAFTITTSPQQRIQVQPSTEFTEQPFITSSELTAIPTTSSVEWTEQPFTTRAPLPNWEEETAPTPTPSEMGGGEDYDYTNSAELTNHFTTLRILSSTVSASQNGVFQKKIKNQETSSEEIQPNVILNKGPCPTPNQISDRNRTDVLFLLDSSDAFNERKFHRALQLISDTVQHFHNFGADGTQVSLVQYNDDPYLEFSLRKHNCKQSLLDDIADTEYMAGGNQLSNALSKVSQFAFTKKRGDRQDAPNVLIIVTDGESESRAQHPITLGMDHNATVLVITTLEAPKQYIEELAGSNRENLFALDHSTTLDLSWNLARRIADLSQFSTPPTKLTPIRNQTSPTVPPTVHHNSIVHLECVADGFKIKVSPPIGFHGVAVVKGYQDDVRCKSTASSDGTEVNLFIGNTECGVTQVTSFEPKGLNSSLVLHLLHDDELSTGEDRAYLLQCFVGTPEDTELSTNLDVVRSELTIAETISLSTLPPTCTYSIRKGAPDGPIVSKAIVGQTVYHRWDCDGSNETTNAYGIQIHSCYASDDVERRFAFLDPRGCSSDLALLSDLTYSEDSLSAYAASHVFSVHDAESLKFVCKLSLCTRDGDGCEGVTPPACGNSTNSDLLPTRRLTRNQNSALDEALTSALSTKFGVSSNSVNGVKSLVSTIATNQLFWLFALLAILATILTSILSRESNASETATTCSDPTSISDSRDFTSSPDISMHSGAVNPNNRLADFMQTFDRTRYV